MDVQKWHNMNQTQLEEDYLNGKRNFVNVPVSRLEQFLERKGQKYSAREQTIEIEESNDEYNQMA